MTAVTLEHVKAEHARIGQLISQLEAAARAPFILALPETRIELQMGEHYAGLVLGDDGAPSHHLVLLAPHPSERMDWSAAKAWATSVGGELPTRREQSLLFANLKDWFDKDWYWSSEPREDDGAYAWNQSFTYGNQLTTRTSFEGRVRAVRRITA